MISLINQVIIELFFSVPLGSELKNKDDCSEKIKLLMQISAFAPNN